MKKRYLFLPVLLFSCGVLRPKHKNYAYKWYDNKTFEKSLILVPTTTVDNLVTKTPISGQFYHQSPYKFKSFESYIIHTDSFYIYQFEVTNEGYRTFLFDIKSKDSSLYKKMWPDEEVWRSKYSYYEPFVEYYFLSPYYNHYPVVGISYNQANEYCKWLTEDYKKNKNRKYKNAVFKLPTKAQWFVAAIGHNHNRILPWDGTSVQNEKGQQLANYYPLPQIGRDTGYLKLDKVDIP
ncbi:MAG: hypothetical protein ACI9JN_000737 [Bacteroidia bacterium]|jgi:hypothetical protein